MNGRVRCQAPAQNYSDSATEVQKGLLSGTGAQVPGTVTELQRERGEP